MPRDADFPRITEFVQKLSQPAQVAGGFVNVYNQAENQVVKMHTGTGGNWAHTEPGGTVKSSSFSE